MVALLSGSIRAVKGVNPTVPPSWRPGACASSPTQRPWVTIWDTRTMAWGPASRSLLLPLPFSEGGRAFWVVDGDVELGSAERVQHVHDMHMVSLARPLRPQRLLRRTSYPTKTP